ncbi:hypothetical protein RHECNPAF_13300148 [Rhizobium etli CNPAF512]|nr:hypothetical protein RHECNPAF_13300148 [Rhizobium etli CNPAF512]
MSVSPSSSRAHSASSNCKCRYDAKGNPRNFLEIAMFKGSITALVTPALWPDRLNRPQIDPSPPGFCVDYAERHHVFRILMNQMQRTL